MTLRTVKIGSLAPGINNRLEPTDLATIIPPRKPATFLYAAENVDIDVQGHLKRRQGYTTDTAGSRCQVWGDGADDGYGLVSRTLVQLTAGSPLKVTALRSGMYDAPISFARTATGAVAWSNGLQSGMIQNGATRPLATPKPTAVPIATVVAGGLPAGRYQFAFTRMSAYDESGSTVPFHVDVPANGGVQLTGLASDTLVYMTGPDGSVFNQVFTAGTILSLTNTGHVLRTLLLDSMPAGTQLAVHNGSLLSAAGNILYISEPYRYGLYNPSKGFIAFPSEVTVLAPCDGGIYVCADQTYWLPGNLFDTKLAGGVQFPFGGLPGSATYDATDKKAYWASKQGLIVGDGTGVAKKLQNDQLQFGDAVSGASVFRAQDGKNHVIVSRLGAGVALTASQTYLAAATNRKTTL